MISKELLSEVLKIDDICGIKIEEDKWVCILYHYGRDICEEVINIYELAFRTREYLKTKSKHLSLNQSIDDIFKEANDIYESLSK